jgi:plastocyanin
MRSRWGRVAVGGIGAAIMAAVSAIGAADTGTLHGKITCRTLADCLGALVYVDKIPGGAAAPRTPVVMDQVNLTFVPHVLPVVSGTTVVFPNSDDVRHNVFSASKTKRFNLGTYPRGVSKQLVFDAPGVVELLCNIHPEMSAYVVVTESPFAAVVSPDGSYRIDRVPAGTLTLVAWHERLAEQRQAVVLSEGESRAVNFDLR